MALIWPFQFQAQSPPAAEKSSISLHELSELVAYEEIDEEDNAQEGHNPHQRRSLRSMHNYIPIKPFRATIRRQQRPSHANSPNQDTLAVGDDGDFGLNVDSPASFPPTPFSRAYVMNRASERVISVMFAARDRLRLEAQSVSRDEYSRMAAKEAQSSGQFAVFDPRRTSTGIALTCGNHCAIKVGQGLVCSCSSMVPVRTNAYVYFEFSVTVGSAQEPQLAVGLAPPDCPLNVLVGSWARSVGLYYDGQVMVGSRWFQSPSAERIVAGSTVGILAYIPFSPQHHDSSAAVAEDKFTDVNEGREETQPELVRPSPIATDPISHHHVHTMHSPLITMYPQRDILLNFNVNGKPAQFGNEVEEAFREIVSLNAPLYPTVRYASISMSCCGLDAILIFYLILVSFRRIQGNILYCYYTINLLFLNVYFILSICILSDFGVAFVKLILFIAAVNRFVLHQVCIFCL